jgi:UDP-glucose 4-epimerase
VDAVERVVGRAVPLTIGPRRAGDPGILFASSARIKRELGWTPQFEEIDMIVRTAWQWRAARPSGYRTPEGLAG